MITTGIISKKTLIVDEKNKPLPGVHLSWGNGGGTTTDQYGNAVVLAPTEQRITISHIGKENDYITLSQLPSKIVLINKMESLDEVVITSRPSTKTPNYLFPALGAAAFLLLLMSAGSDPKQVTL